MQLITNLLDGVITIKDLTFDELRDAKAILNILCAQPQEDYTLLNLRDAVIEELDTRKKIKTKIENKNENSIG